MASGPRITASAVAVEHSTCGVPSVQINALLLRQAFQT